MAMSLQEFLYFFIFFIIIILWEQEFSVSYAKQSANSIAHSFAKYAKQIDYEIVWLEESPPHALEALYFDHCCFMNE